MESKVSVEETGEITRDITIKIPSSEYKKRYDSLLSNTASRAQIKGFRPGRVPRDMVVKMYGQQIHSDVVNDLVWHSLEDAVKKHELKVVGTPHIDMLNDKPEEDISVKAKVYIFPNPTIKNYFGVSFEVEINATDEKAFEKYLENFLKGYAKLEKVEGREVAVSGDIVKADFMLKVEGEETGRESKNAYIEIGSGQFPKAVEQGLVGVSAGAEKTVTFTVAKADKLGKDLEGKEVTYTIQALEILTRAIPELNEEFVKTTGIAEDIEGFKAKVREQFSEENKRINKEARETELFKAIAEKNTFEIPPVMIDEEIRQILFEMGLLDPRNKKSYQVNVEQFRQPLGEPAETRVRREIVLSRIIEQEELKATDEDLEAWFEELTQLYSRTREEVEKMVNYPQSKDRLLDAVARKKMTEQLLEKAKVKEKAA